MLYLKSVRILKSSLFFVVGYSQKVGKIESEWSSSIEKKEELIEFIIQVIKTDIYLHPIIADLIIELQNSAQEKNKSSILIPIFFFKWKSI